jgi:hypothetical protein
VYLAVAALAGFAVADRALGATSPSFDKMSMDDRLTNAPDATVVKIGTLTTTLGKLRAAHRAREASLSQGGALGTAAHGKLTTVVGPSAIGIAGAKAVNVSGAPSLTLTPIVEPPSQYASAPADFKAFCSAAAASACLYLPPDQVVTTVGTAVSDFDPLVTQSQCGQEGGSWETYASFGDTCAFKYPTAALVHFTPAASYKYSQAVHCDSSMFMVTIDEHGAIYLTSKIPYGAVMTTDDDATCIVSVTPGA